MKDEKEYCNKCEKCMTNKQGNSLIGLEITVQQVGDSIEDKEFVKKQLGKFYKMKKYQLCFECWYESMGAKLK